MPNTTAESLEDLDDEQLMARAQHGNRRAFRVVFDRYRDPLLRFVVCKIGDQERAQDVVQGAFVRCWRHLHRFDTDQSFSTWIHTITYNLAKNELRNRSRARDDLNVSDLQRDDGPTDDGGGHRRIEEGPHYRDDSRRPEREAARREVYRLVREAIERLPPHHREVVALREVEGKSYQEIADATGQKLGTIKSRLARGRVQLVQNLRDLGVEDHLSRLGLDDVQKIQDGPGEAVDRHDLEWNDVAEIRSRFLEEQPGQVGIWCRRVARELGVSEQAVVAALAGRHEEEHVDLRTAA